MTAAVVIVLVVGARLLVPLGIPRRPVPALVAALVLDAVDQTAFSAVGADFDGYQGYDKALDVYYLAIAYASMLRNWPGGTAFAVGRFLWYYRLVGVAAFELTHERALLLLFPNTFEYYFLAYELLRTREDPRRLTGRQAVALAAGLWVLVKLPQEWWVHVAQLDVTDQLAAHPEAIPVLVVAVAAALGGLAVVLRRRPADWPPTTRVDAHLPPARSVGPGRRLPLLSRPFAAKVAEKALLVSLVVVIFAQVLPGVRATTTQLVVATTVFIVANAVVSQLLARRGATWRSTLAQFTTMLAVNAGINVLLRLLPREGGATFELGAGLFFTLLLTLLVTLYDRYRTVRHQRAGLLSRLPVPTRPAPTRQAPSRSA